MRKSVQVSRFDLGVMASWRSFLLNLFVARSTNVYVSAVRGSQRRYPWDVFRPTAQQWQRLHSMLGPSLRLLLRLRDRLNQRGIARDSAYLRAVERAFDSMHHLSVLTHYAGCDRGVCATEPTDGDAELWRGEGI
jgi:hypothetical protein